MLYVFSVSTFSNSTFPWINSSNSVKVSAVISKIIKSKLIKEFK
jgi:hypothetical protein